MVMPFSSISFFLFEGHRVPPQPVKLRPGHRPALPVVPEGQRKAVVPGGLMGDDQVDPFRGRLPDHLNIRHKDRRDLLDLRLRVADVVNVAGLRERQRNRVFQRRNHFFNFHNPSPYCLTASAGVTGRFKNPPTTSSSVTTQQSPINWKQISFSKQVSIHRARTAKVSASFQQPDR